MLLTESYRELNRQLHRDPTYGVSGHKCKNDVIAACQAVQSTDILDYGCGKMTLEGSLGFPIKNYDPCIPGLDFPPEPADVVVCTDVLEHIEPDCIDAVLDDLYRLTKKMAVFLIANRPALRALPDGRNAHLIQEGPEWWLPKIWARGFRLVQYRDIRNQGIPIAFLVTVDKEGWWQPTAKQ